MIKFLKIFAIIILSFLILLCSLFVAYLIITKDAVLDKNKLTGSGQNVIICDENGNEIASASIDQKNKSVTLADLQQHTVNAFIASEDRTFYKHNGLNYKRILKAMYKNIVSGSFKEGASTISQQLIKNTHLSNDKTIKRKLNEIKLTKKLEKLYDKDTILEMYLNTIYFGHNCYGLQSAAQFYFNKQAEELNLEESATIVGLLASPNNYSPFKNPEKSLQRRNLVLKSMKDCGYIGENEYNTTIEMPISAEKAQSNDVYGDYINAVFDELEEIDFNYYSLSNGCTIKTYLNAQMQEEIETLNYQCDNSVIITDNTSGGVNAYKSTIGGAKRQPGSTVKPIFVYAPAIEEKQLSPFTKILDEQINYNGYTPENFDKQYHGYVTVAESLKNSYNIPAVKTLNSITVERAQRYLTAMNISLEDDEKNLSLALGGMKYGLSIKELADCYTVFPNGGNFRPSRFIKEIVTSEGKILYSNQTAPNHVYGTGTCSLINEMLIDTAKSGTAKKLKDLNFNVAAKTGTCGNSEGNTDAYAVGYTTEHCIAVWLGDKDNNRSNITGGNDCCALLKTTFEKLYESRQPANLDTLSGTVTVTLDAEEYFQNNKVILADPASPKLNLLTVKVLTGNEPKDQSTRFTNPYISTPTLSVKNNTVIIELCHAKYYSFIVKRINGNKNEVIYDGKWKENVSDSPEEGIYTYSVTPYYSYNNMTYTGKEILLPTVNITADNSSLQVKIPDLAGKDWYNQ